MEKSKFPSFDKRSEWWLLELRRREIRIHNRLMHVAPGQWATLECLEMTAELANVQFEELQILAGRVLEVSNHPPVFAERLMLITCRPEIGEALVGDLREQHTRLLSGHGRRYADLWYWAQVARSIWPLLWASLWRLVAIREMLKRLMG